MTTRRLAAILAADVVGYSRLVGADEPGTLAKLAALRSEVVDPKMGAHGGRVFKTTGDGLLAEFPSGVQALQCAVAIQQAMGAQGGIQLRIGLHSADVVVQPDGDLLGDGVNVAARLEALAEPGGICLSDRMREDAAGKLSLDLEDLGERELKNITRKVRVFRVRLGVAERPALPLPDKPSIAVLPFQNMSGDPEQEYFADGVVEDIITALSRVGWLFVIARNSSFAYKGTSPDIRRVGRELGVRYVLEGSIRRSGSRVRITAQLIEAATGGHVWAERFEDNSADLFELQDRITERLVGAFEPNLQRAEIARATSKPTESLDAYDLYLRALQQSHLMTEGSNLEARRLLKLAISTDDRFGLAKAAFAISSMVATVRNWIAWGSPEMLEGVAMARSAIIEAPDDPLALAFAGITVAYLGHDLDAARAAFNRAIFLDSNSARVLGLNGWVRNLLGDFDEARESFTRAIRLSPLDANLHLYRSGLAMALAYGEPPLFEQALDQVQKVLEAAPTEYLALQLQIEIFVMQGRIEEAQETARRFMSLYPATTISGWRRRWRYGRELTDRMTERYRAAGIPE